MRGSWMGLLLLVPMGVDAKIYLYWDYDLTYVPQPASFELVLAGPQGLTPPVSRPMQIPRCAPDTCLFLPGAVTQTCCVELACPGPGIFSVTAYAVWPATGQKSGPSNTVTMQVVSAPVCTALRLDPLPPQPP